eukprot:9025251-Pyramimonas_sp.AAC.1
MSVSSARAVRGLRAPARVYRGSTGGLQGVYLLIWLIKPADGGAGAVHGGAGTGSGDPRSLLVTVGRGGGRRAG